MPSMNHLRPSRGQVPRKVQHLAYKVKAQGDIVHTHINMHKQSGIEKLVKDYVRSTTYP